MTVFEISNLTRLYGPRCPRCLELTGAAAGTNICPECGTVVALNGVNLRVPEGEVLGIIGESGSGKTTLLRYLYGLDFGPAVRRYTGTRQARSLNWRGLTRRSGGDCATGSLASFTRTRIRD